ncbi:YolD-like family protein [Fictibacillus enclensis]|uniref:YolD-like family protein n=1 Tax=Fictibacillus enclensis TaxID=1017270 RepID=UPI0025A1DC3C|nr:YolD-like family protein [Fictibacillus enclensis]MDM5338502.1 YolD-like family protein [Fictibacillus enclensis]
MLRDRGTLKWQGMFMPEHVKLLREMDWDNKKKTKPELDEQQLELMEETICEAMAENINLCFTYFSQGDFHLLIGKVHYIDPYKKELRIVDFYDEVHKINFSDLMDVRNN